MSRSKVSASAVEYISRAVDKLVEDAIQSKLTRPITYELFKDPVLCSGDGFTYERSAIE